MARRNLPVILALFSGVLLGCAFPPVDLKWFAWVGLVPLLLTLERAPRPRVAFLYGYLAGLVFFVITLHPLVSVHAWSGWTAVTERQLAMRLTRQWWFMQGNWLAFSVWCAVLLVAVGAVGVRRSRDV